MPSACLNMREIGFRPDSPGGMGEYMVVEEQYVHAVLDDWRYEDAAWVETFSIGYFGIWGNGGYIDAGDIVLIFGAGPVGLSAAMEAKTSGVRVFMVDPIESRRTRSLSYGVDEVINPAEGKLEERINGSHGRGRRQRLCGGFGNGSGPGCTVRRLGPQRPGSLDRTLDQPQSTG
jgi:L-iditol 2-dehydrogenase